jgi:ribosomal protein S18 acetylase RimI-like enzyme
LGNNLSTGTPVKITVRIAGVPDALALRRLNVAFNGGDEPPEYIAARLADPRCVEKPILAEIDGQAVGFAALRVAPCVFYPEPHAELTELYVEPEYRRKGVGRALVSYAQALAQEVGAKGLVVLTSLSNHAAQAFYHALGYRDDDLALWKDLPGNV